LALASCDIPAQMQVSQGVDPQNEDRDVRFRTVYYFRVFDYCEDINPAGKQPADDEHIFPEKRGQPLRLIKDSIYRFRMTGKASSLFSVVHFESGTLKASQIDPFGANVAFDDKNGQFFFKSQDEVKAEATREATLNNIDRYISLRDRFKDGDPLRDDVVALIKNEIHAIDGSSASAAPTTPAIRKKLEQIQKDARADAHDAFAQAVTAIDAATAAYQAAGDDAGANDAKGLKTPLVVPQQDNDDPGKNGVNGAVDQDKNIGDAISETHKLLNFVEADANQAYGAAVTAAAAADKAVATAQKATSTDAVSKLAIAKTNAQSAAKARDGAKGRLDSIKKREADLDQAALVVVSSTTADSKIAGAEVCPSGNVVRRGFQVLGPEGVRTFNQDDRLVMAMSSDGKPLIGVLQDLSGRILNQKVNESDQLLPLVQERLNIVSAQRVLDGKKPVDTDSASAAIDAVIAAFGDPQQQAKTPGVTP
jgi:hypothetical protein